MSGTLSPLDGQVKDPKGVYPLNWEINLSSISSPTLLFNKNDQVSDAKIYPDFKVWKHTPNEDVIMNSHLQKGYFEPTVVTSECHSGRQVITQLLQKSSSQPPSALTSSAALPPPNNNNTINNNNSNINNNNNSGNETADNIYIAKMKALGGVLVKSMYRRREINRIKSKSSYKPPPRVTLTEHKREIWLKNLANQKISLRQLARAIPHGLRNKILLEQCANHRVPINRAIWLIKCVSSNEQRQLKRKATSVSSMVMVTNKWIIEWTEQITIFLEQVIENCFNSDSGNKNWKFKLDYAIGLIVNLYIEELMNRTTFLTWIVRFLSKIVRHQKVIVTDLKSLSVHYLLVKLFWFKIIKIDYLAKELSECMLYVIAKIHELPKNPLYDSITFKLNSVFQYLIKYLFYYNSDTFIIPSSWSYLKPHLKRVLDLKIGLVGDQFKLITYRNESLMIDDSERSISLGQSNKDKLQEHEYNLPRDKISLIIHKLDNFKNGQIIDLTKLVFEDSNNNINNSEQSNWKKNFTIILQWCIQTTRTEKLSYQRISLVIFILQCRQAQLSQFKAKKYKQFKSEMELKITEFVYQMSEILSFRDNVTEKGNFYNLNYFLILINKLHTLKLFVVSSYLRRLIASGVIYLSEADRSCYIHLLILNSLPDLKDSNSRNILKRLGDSTGIQLQNLNVKKLKDIKFKFLNRIFDSDCSEIIYNDLYHLTQECFGYNLEESFQIGQEVELGKFFINELVDRLNRNQRLLLNVSKLMALYRLCNNHFNKLSQLIRIIVEILEEEDPNIILADESTLLLLLKLICFNSKLLSSTFYESTTSVYEYCCQIINTWIITDNRYNISKVILKAKIPSLLISDFELNIAPETNKLEYSNLTLENLAILGVSSYERLGNAAEFSHHLNIGITRYYNTIKGLEVENRPMIINFLKCLKNWKPVEFQDLLRNYLKKFIQPTLLLDYELNLKAILKLVIDDLMGMKTVFDVFNANSLVNDGFSSNSSERLLCDILFNTQLELDEYEYFLLCFERMIYKTDYEKDYFNSLAFVVKTPFRKTKELPTTEDVNMVGVDDVVSVDVINSFHQLTNVSQMETNQTEKSDDREEYEKRLNNEVVNALWDLITSRLEIFIEIFYETNNEGLNNHLLRNFFFTKMLKINDFNRNLTNNNNFSEINEIIKNINYFNLPVCQWLFESIVAEEYSNIGDNVETTNKFLILVNNVLIQMSELDNHNNNQVHDNMYLVGELFVLLSNRFKLKILAACEEHYLNSDNFPTVLVNGENMTNFLNNVISSCSRLSEDSSLKVELTDALVFSLNLSLEKLMYFCHNLEHHKKNIQNRVKSMQDLEAGVKLISKIILIHKTFLVELIMKRSVNLQRDVLLLNLTKLFNNRIMNKNPKLKNLLYDVLISIKVYISESISQQYQKNISLSQNQTTSLIMNKSNSASSFLTLINSPKSQSNLNNDKNIGSPSANNNMLTNMPNILNIKPPNFNNNLRYLLSRFNIKDTIMEKNLRLYAVHENYDGNTDDDDNMLRFNYKKFELIEDSSPANSLNDSSISLQLFDCSINKQNPK